MDNFPFSIAFAIILPATVLDLRKPLAKFDRKVCRLIEVKLYAGI